MKHQAKRTGGRWADVLHGLLPSQSQQTIYSRSWKVRLTENISGVEGLNSPMLNTSDVNQNAFTAFAVKLWVSLNENCKLVAVTEEKKVAMVERLSRFCAPCF